MSQSMTSDQLTLFDLETVPYGYCPNCFGGWSNIYPRSDIDAIHCAKCDTVVDGSRWEKRIEREPNLHLRNLIAKYGYDKDSDW